VIAHYDLGTVYDKQGNTTRAVEEYRAALVIEPTFADALFNLAVDTTGADPAGAAQLYFQSAVAAAGLRRGLAQRGLHSPERRQGRRGKSRLGTGSRSRPVAGRANSQRAVHLGSRNDETLTNPEAVGRDGCSM